MADKRQHAGMASVLSLLFLGLFSALGVAYVCFANSALRQAGNYARVQTARMQAESGLAYCTYLLRESRLPAGRTGQDMLDSLANWLAANLNGRPNLQGAVVTYDGGSITVPSIATDEMGRNFEIRLSLGGEALIHARVTGRDGVVMRAVGMDFHLTTARSGVFDHGVASGGPVRMSGNARIEGANDPSEAGVLSATYATAEAFKLTGGAWIDGDIYASNPSAYVTLSGNVGIGGESNWDAAIHDHIHIGIGETVFPEVDPTVFEPFATNIVSSETDTSGDKTFSNIRVLAYVNPTFSGNVELNGVIFVEAPNRVHFSGNATIVGVIVTEDAGEGVYADNYIKFTGNTVSRGVEELPDTAEFADLRKMPGSCILAPGFSLRFSGNFGAISGCMAADDFKFTGNAGGTIRGLIIHYSNAEFQLAGNSTITIDRAGTPDVPPGFVMPGTLYPVASTYMEY